MVAVEQIREKDIKLIEKLRQIAIPFGEVIVRIVYQDGVPVLLKVIDKEETIKL